MSLDGGMPSAAYNPYAVGAVGGMSDAAKQMWLCSWLPILDCKAAMTPLTDIVPFFSKQMLPGANACKLLPCMPQGFLAKMFAEIFKGFSLENWAHDLSSEQVAAIMEARGAGISSPDSGASVSMQALGAMRNVAMSHAAMDDGGHGVG